MENRIIGLQKIYDLVLPLFQTYPLKFFDIAPDAPIDKEQIPAVIMVEGGDEIIKRSSRSYPGYPAARELEVVLECWDSTLEKCRSLYQAVRGAVLSTSGVLATGIVVREVRAVGPFNLDIPGVKGMRIVFLMRYQDEGPT